MPPPHAPPAATPEATASRSAARFAAEADAAFFDLALFLADAETPARDEFGADPGFTRDKSSSPSDMETNYASRQMRKLSGPWSSTIFGKEGRLTSSARRFSVFARCASLREAGRATGWSGRRGRGLPMGGGVCALRARGSRDGAAARTDLLSERLELLELSAKASERAGAREGQSEGGARAGAHAQRRPRCARPKGRLRLFRGHARLRRINGPAGCSRREKIGEKRV